MSALETNRFMDGDYYVYEFKQDIYLPSYLVALVAGNLKNK